MEWTENEGADENTSQYHSITETISTLPVLAYGLRDYLNSEFCRSDDSTSAYGYARWSVLGADEVGRDIVKAYLEKSTRFPLSGRTLVE
jgi:hypothetical protein